MVRYNPKDLTKERLVKKSLKDADKMNLRIRDVAAKVNDILVMFQLKRIPVTVEALKLLDLI